MKAFQYCLIISLLLLGEACSEDLLQVTDPNNDSQEDFFQRIEEVNQSLTAAYSPMSDIHSWGFQFMPYFMLTMGLETDMDWVNTPDWNEISTFEMKSANAPVRRSWHALFRGVARTNDFFDNANFYLENFATENDRPTINLMLGQAHFLRGFYYFHLIRLYGADSPDRDPNALGVPYHKDGLPLSDEEVYKPRNTVGEVYQYILEDFSSALELLNDVDSWDAENIARVDRYTVLGYLGKVHLYLGNNEEAISFFDQVINSGQFNLALNLGEYPNNPYDNLFHGKNEFSEESIWELNFGNHEISMWNGGAQNGYPIYIAPWTDNRQSYNNLFVHHKNIARLKSDPRLKINTLEPFTDSVRVFKGGALVPVKPYPTDPAGMGWSFNKYVERDFAPSQNNETAINFIFMRLADIYLLKAEAHNNLGQDLVALEWTNKVRRRAYGAMDFDSPVDSIDFKDLTGSQLRDSIREERFRELFSEGHRWYDIKRWRIAPQESQKIGSLRSGVINFDEDTDYALPIPIDEMTTNRGMIQNPGY